MPTADTHNSPPRLSFRRAPSARSPWFLLAPTAVALAVVIVLFSLSRQLANRSNHVVVYTSQDQVYAEPIFREFERQSGIRVLAVFDSEAVKTVGLANRLLAETNQPQGDVFWNNEALRTAQLISAGALSADPLIQIGYRSRRLVINTNLVPISQAPASLVELTNACWRGRVALAYPLFGTTATHFLALRLAWGETNWLNWCRALHSNQPLLVDGNSLVVRLVGKGQASIGLTDSDDIAAGQHEGFPIAALPLSRESLLIPNTAARVARAPHPDNAQRFLAFLQQPDIAQALVNAHALENASTSQLQAEVLRPNWTDLARELEPATESLRGIFLR